MDMTFSESQTPAEKSS